MPRPFRDWGRRPLILVVFGFTLLAIFVHPGFVFGLVLAAGLLHGYRRRRTRDAELRPVAARLGLTYTTVSGSHLRSLPPFVTLRGAWNQGNVTELMSGTREDLSISLFEFDDTAPDADQQTRLRVAVAADPSLRLPAFLVLPRSSSVDERSVPGLRGLLTAEVLDFFSQRPGVIAEGADGGVLMHRPPCPPAELGALLDDTLALARALRRALRAGGPPS